MLCNSDNIGGAVLEKNGEKNLRNHIKVKTDRV
jgi:hypothetical protein